jgi:hypothetical protein
MLALLTLAASLAARSAAEDLAPASTATLRGVHFTGWTAGSPKARVAFAEDMKRAGFNAVVIALRDFDGHVFVPDVPLAEKTRAYVRAIPDLPGAVKDFKDRGIYAIARIAVFKDDHLARARPDLAVHFPDGSIWTNASGTAWVDPYRQEVRDYAIEIATRAAAAGFDEIQFDYIRFPSDGNTRLCRYSRADHSDETSAAALREFLAQARAQLKPLGVKLSICTFGLTTSVDSGMGIGQHLDQLADLVDFVSPMMYPSHYAKGQYGLKDPNADPYLTIQQGVRDALDRLGGRPEKLRPYLQDFSLGVRYTPAHVRAQILAAEELGVRGWLLWNAQNHYTWSAAEAGPVLKPALASARGPALPPPALPSMTLPPPVLPSAAPADLQIRDRFSDDGPTDAVRTEVR